MDKRKQYKLTAHPAHLWIGTHARNRAIQELKEILCNCKISNCTICASIEQNQHQDLLWLKPNKLYTLADIEPIFDIIKFKLEENINFFFILEKADYLSTAVANRLLKFIEEPPTGYHILFLAQRIEQVLITIRSRCFITFMQDPIQNQEIHPLVRFFMSPPVQEPIIFLQMLDKVEINESETFEYIDQLLTFWQEIESTNKYKNNMITLLMNSLDKPPMPGSSKLFWKNFYLHVLDSG